MHRRAVLRSAICCVCLTSVATLAQQLQNVATAEKPGERSPSVRQSAMSLVEEALAGTGSLTIPSNRLAIELRAFPIVWSRSDARARALVQQMAGEFAQAANAATQDRDQNPAYALNELRNQRCGIARAIAISDPDLALLFVSATLPYLKSIAPEDDPDDHALIVELAAQVALHNPRRALDLAEQQLKETDDLPQSMIDLLDQVQRNDPQVGSHLFHDIVDHLRRQNLTEDVEALSFAASLLGSQFSRQSETGQPDDVLRTLAETVATAALSPGVLPEKSWVLSDALTALDALVPARSAALHSGNGGSTQAPSVQNSFWQKFNQAQSSGNDSQTLTLLSQAPDEVRLQAALRAAREFADRGDLERTLQVAQGLEPWQRNTMMQSALVSAALAAGSRSDFPSARQLAAQITDEDSRATVLSSLAIFANGNGKTRVAEEMLGEASSLVVNHNAGTSAFAAQLRVAQAYLRVKPAQAIPLLERSATQIEQALSAAAQLDGFLPDSHSFAGNELILNQGFLYNQLLEPYAMATAELATFDLPAARILANRLPLPEARMMTEIFVAAGVLGKMDQTQNAVNASNNIRLRFVESY
ncbi:MAG TPA: hypothetical protein VE377_24845 [Candidatus Dormibacteraeota bacterium]|nr:hypothetical protein [Candidatus Dormibacteraeota bacterium]